MTEYQHTTIYRIDGIHLGEREVEAEVISNSEVAFRALLLTDPDAYCFEGDRYSVVANLMLNALLGQPGLQGPEERLADELQEIRETRKRKFGAGPFLVLVREGNVEDFSPRHEKEMEDFVVCFEGTPKEPLRQASEPHVFASLTALAVSIDSVSGLHMVSDTVIFFRKDGKPIYSFTPSATANASVSRAISEEVLESVGGWYRIIFDDQQLGRVNRLLVSSLQTEGDCLRAFLSAWTASEILINKTFSSYEERFFQELNEGDHPRARRQYLQRIRSVMKDKHRLTDKFALIASVLCPEEADEDVEQFTQAKEIRDKLSHGQDVHEASLPVQPLQELARKYLRFHLSG